MVMVHFYMKYVGNTSPSNVGKVSLRGPEKPGLLWSQRAGGLGAPGEGTVERWGWAKGYGGKMGIR